MRKRQWKKILSVVLALAMVFSMNVSAFADEVTDPVAVEEPAAETPVAEEPAPETPVAEEPVAEEPVAETPAAEEPVAEEPAPAEEAAPAEGEEAAGDLSGLATAGFSISPETGVTFDANVLTLPEGEFTLTVIENAPASAITVKNAAGEAASFTVVAKPDQTAAAIVNVQKADTGSLSGTVDTSTVVVGAEGALYKSNLAAATTTSAEYKVYPDKKDTPDGTFGSANINPAGGKFADGVVVYKADGTEVTFEAVEKAAETTDAIPYYVVTAASKDLKVVAVPKKAAGAESFTGTLESNGTSIDVSEADDGKEYGAFAGDTLVDTNVATSNTATLTGLELGTKYTVKLRTVSAATAFASMWSPGKDITTPVLPVVTTGEITEDCEINSAGEVTVSGLKITGPFKGTAVRKDKDIFEVTVSDGKVTVEKDATAPQKAVSFNIIKNGGAIFSVGTSGKYAGGMITLKGTNTVSLDCANGEYKIFTDDTINVEGDVTLSANNSGEALVISENSAFKVVRAEKDAPVKPSGKIKVYLAREDTTGFAAAAGIKLDKNTIDSTAGDKFVISNNKVFKLGANAKFNVEECGANDAVGYGKTVVWSNHGDFGAASAIKYQTLPEQEAYELGKYTIELAAGAITNGGIDLDRVIVKKDGKSYLYNQDRSTLFGSYQFALSTNASMKVRDLYDATYHVDNNYTGHGYGLVAIDTLGHNAEAGKTYTLYARRKAGTGFASAAVALGTFTVKADEKLVIDSSIGQIYYGGQGKDADGYITDAIDSGAIKLSLGNYSIKKDDDGNLSAYNAAGKKIGEIGVYIFKKTTFDTKKAALLAADVVESTADINADFKLAEDTNNLKDMVSANGYYVEAFFSTAHAERVELSKPLSSNVLSFNVAAAPVTIKTAAASAPVNKYLTTGNLEGEDWTAVNDITGEDCSPSDFAGAAVYQVNGKLSDEVSFNAATVTTYTVSEGKIKPAEAAPGLAKYVISKIEPGKLTIYGEVQKSGVAVTPGTVYYGENKGSIAGNMKVTYNNGAETLEADYADGVYAIEFYKPETLSGGTVSGGSKTVVPEQVDADTQVAAIVTIDKDKIVGTNSQNIVMPAVTFTVQKRPINIGFTDCSDATGTGLHSKRNITLKDNLSANKTKLDHIEDEVEGIDNGHTNSGTLKPETDKANVLSENAVLDAAYINIEKAGTYSVPVSNLVLATKYAKNFVITDGYANYKIDPVYYAYYILEYGGHKVKTGKKTVYQEVQEENGEGKVVWQLPEKLQTVSGFANFGGAITDKNDKVVELQAQDKIGAYKGTFDFDKFDKKQVTSAALGKQDIYFHAIVEAYATSDVTIKTLAPVTYDGRKHMLANYDYKKNARPESTKSILYDIGDLVVTDKSNSGTKTLTLNKDYKVSVKNNTNASVKYDTSKSLSDNLSDKGAVTQLFAEKKRPQVVITGIGDYKGMKATVFFDILPRDINIDETEAGVRYYVDPDAGKLQTTIDNYLKLGKKKGVKYSYKLVDTLRTGKKATLKKNKDFTESFVKYAYGAYKTVDPKNLTETGDAFGVILTGTGNYYGTVPYDVTVIANNAKLFSELGWSAKNVNYKATGVSTDSAKGNFNVKASKKYNKKKLVYGTDYTAVITDGPVVDDKTLAYDAGKYEVTIEATEAFEKANEADIKAGKLYIDTKILYPTIKGKKLTKKMFTIKPDAKGVAFSGESFDVEVTSRKLTADKDYISLPKTFTIVDKATFAAITEDELKEKLGESYVYVTNEGYINYDQYAAIKNNTEHSMAFNADGNQKDTDVFEYTFNAANAQKRDAIGGGNYKPGTYNVTMIGKGAYNGSFVTLSYKVKGAKLTNKTVNSVLSADKVEANINGTKTGLNLKLPYKVKAWHENEKGEWKLIETDVVTLNDRTEYGDHRFFTAGTKDWKNNTKATTKAKVTIHPTEYSGYEVTKKGVTGTFKIDVATISKNQVVSYNEFARLGKADRKGLFYVTIEDKADKAKTPKVTMYQAKQNGEFGKAIKQKTDYTFTANTVSSCNNTVSINAGKGKKSSYKVTETATVKKYDVYAKAGKKWEIELSANATALSYNIVDHEWNSYTQVPMTLNKKGNSGTVEYTGNWIGPVVQNLTVDGVQIITNGKPADGKKISYSIETVTDGKSVGTQKYKITIRNGYDNKAMYEVGGSKVFTYKIVPQKSTGLILSK